MDSDKAKTAKLVFVFSLVWFFIGVAVGVTTCFALAQKGKQPGSRCALTRPEGRLVTDPEQVTNHLSETEGRGCFPLPAQRSSSCWEPSTTPKFQRTPRLAGPTPPSLNRRGGANDFPCGRCFGRFSRSHFW